MKPKFVYGLIFVLSFLSLAVGAQSRKCMTMQNLEQRYAEDPGLRQRMIQSEKALQDWLKNHPQDSKSGNGDVITIQTVVHVIYKAEVENISDEQIMSQMDVLNKDFRLMNTDKLPSDHPFFGVVSDSKIQFQLATKDPNGNPTTGITRTPTQVASWTSENYPKIKSTAQGGKDNWDPTRYLNMYVVNLDGQTLGFATFPEDLTSAPQLDGVVMRYEAFGTTGSAGMNGLSANNLGRTATHEVGHWLNLRHIWGDQQCGDDFVADTKYAEGENYGCPTFPHRPNNQCGANATDQHGEMYMNYMDYVNDNCMNMFTAGQADRMRATLQTSRKGLIPSTAPCTVNTGARNNGRYPNANVTGIQTFKASCTGILTELSNIHLTDDGGGMYTIKLKRGSDILLTRTGALSANNITLSELAIPVTEAENLSLEITAQPATNIAYGVSDNAYPEGELTLDGEAQNGSDLVFMASIGAAAANPCTAPAISAQPQSHNGTIGGNYTLSITATGNNLTYSWQSSSTNTPESFTAIAGANQNSLSISLTQTGTVYYRCIVKSEACETISDVATVVTQAAQAGEAKLITAATSGNVGTSVVIPVSVEGFSNFRTLQGSTDFNGTGLAEIDSVVASQALTSVDGIMGAIGRPSVTSFTFSYESTAAAFSFSNGTVIFNVYGKLKTGEQQFCGTPSAGSTPNQWGNLSMGNPTNTLPSVQYGEVCANYTPVAATIKIDTVESCPNFPLVYVRYTTTGTFNENNAFELHINGQQITSAQSQPNVFTFANGLAVGTYQVVVKRGAIADTLIYQVSDFEAPIFIVNGDTVPDQTKYNVCSGSTAQIRLVSNFGLSWNFLGNTGTNKEFSFQITGEGNELAVFGKNNSGCLSPKETGVIIIEAADLVAPKITLIQGSEVVKIPGGANSVTVDISSRFNVTDNCGLGLNPVTVVNKTHAAESTPANVVIHPGRNDLDIVAFDLVGNKTIVPYVIFGSVKPIYNLSFDKAYSTTGTTENETITMLLTLNGDNTVHRFNSISGKLNLGAFAKNIVSVKPAINFATEQISTQGSVVTFTFTGAELLGTKPLFEVYVEPNMAAGGSDELYVPTISDAIWITEYADTAVINSNFAANTLIGVPLISGTFKQANGLPFSDNAVVTCPTCLQVNGLRNVTAISNNQNSYTFRALKNTVIDLQIQDKSNRTVSQATGMNNVLFTRRHVIKEIALNDINTVAADVDNTNEVNTLDILQQRLNISGEIPLFLNNNNERSYYNFVTQVNGAIGKVANFNVGSSNHTFDFTAVEIGKVEYTMPNLAKSPEEAVAIQLQNQVRNQVVRVPVIAEKFKDVAAYQFTVSWDANLLSYRSTSEVLHNLVEGKSLIEEGKLMLNWMSPDGSNTSYKAGDTLFVLEFGLTFEAQNMPFVKTPVAISSAYTAAGAFDAESRFKEIASAPTVIAVNNSTGLTDYGNGNAISMPFPNPFTDASGTTILLSLPVSQSVTISIFNSVGQLTQQQLYFNEGLNVWEMPLDGNLPSGMYTVQIQGAQFTYQAKVIKQ